MDDFQFIVIGESTCKDVCLIALVDVINVTSYGGFVEYPTKDNDVIIIEFEGPDLIVLPIEENERGDKSNQQSVNYTVTTKTMKFDNVNIKYPQIVSENENYVYANRFLRDYVNHYLNTNYSDDLAFLELAFNTVSLNKNAISFEFNGTLNIKSTAYPSKVMFTINLSLTEGAAIKLSDIFDIDEDFIKFVRSEWNKQAVEASKNELVDYLDAYTNENLSSMLFGADSFESSVYSNFDSKNVYIHFVVPHAVGDYFTIKIPLHIKNTDN